METDTADQSYIPRESSALAEEQDSVTIATDAEMWNQDEGMEEETIDGESRQQPYSREASASHGPDEVVVEAEEVMEYDQYSSGYGQAADQDGDVDIVELEEEEAGDKMVADNMQHGQEEGHDDTYEPEPATYMEAVQAEAGQDGTALPSTIGVAPGDETTAHSAQVNEAEVVPPAPEDASLPQEETKDTLAAHTNAATASEEPAAQASTDGTPPNGDKAGQSKEESKGPITSYEVEQLTELASDSTDPIMPRLQVIDQVQVALEDAPDAHAEAVDAEQVEEVAEAGQDQQNEQHSSPGLYDTDKLDVELEPVRLSFQDQSFAIFSSDPESTGYLTWDEDADTVKAVPAPRLAVEEEIFWLPLEALFDALRVKDALGEFLEADDSSELVMTFPELELTVREDNIYAREISLTHLMKLHHQLGLRDSLHIRISEDSRFIFQYNLLTQQIAQAQKLAEEDESKDKDGDTAETTEESQASITDGEADEGEQEQGTSDDKVRLSVGEEAEETFVTVIDGSEGVNADEDEVAAEQVPVQLSGEDGQNSHSEYADAETVPPSGKGEAAAIAVVAQSSEEVRGAEDREEADTSNARYYHTDEAEEEVIDYQEEEEVEKEASTDFVIGQEDDQEKEKVGESGEGLHISYEDAGEPGVESEETPETQLNGDVSAEDRTEDCEATEEAAAQESDDADPPTDNWQITDGEQENGILTEDNNGDSLAAVGDEDDEEGDDGFYEGNADYEEVSQQVAGDDDDIAEEDAEGYPTSVLLSESVSNDGSMKRPHEDGDSDHTLDLDQENKKTKVI